MSVPTEFNSTLCKTYRTLCISVRQPITEVKAECNAAADVREIATRGQPFYGYSGKPPHSSRLFSVAWGCGGHILVLNPESQGGGV